MTRAENIQELHDGGYERQARRMANAESISLEVSADGSVTEYTFPDGSVFVLGALDAWAKETL